MGLWVADGEKGLILLDGDGNRKIGPPGEALCRACGRIWCAGAGQCRCYAESTGEYLCGLTLPTGVCAMTALGNQVYALSADADSVTAFCAETGEIRCCAPAGMYPRDVCAHPRQKYFLVAGGVSGEMLLLDAALQRLRVYRLPGTVCGACFFSRGMAALCAVERGEALASRLFSVSYRGVTEEIFALPLVPSCLCGLPDGGCAMGCCGETVCFRANKKAAFRQPFSCPLRLRAARGYMLLCEAGEGVYSLPSGRRVYSGANVLDALPVEALQPS
ncbi:MAG: hypothetical protein IKH30_02855 [Clostridia bacterium]|nr:hypothetical protein [Clostridia bacterium]